MKILTTGEAADILKLCRAQVSTLCKKGHLIAYKEGRKGGYRILDSSIVHYVKHKLGADTFELLKKLEGQILEENKDKLLTEKDA